MAHSRVFQYVLGEEPDNVADLIESEDSIAVSNECIDYARYSNLEKDIEWLFDGYPISVTFGANKEYAVISPNNVKLWLHIIEQISLKYLDIMQESINKIKDSILDKSNDMPNIWSIQRGLGMDDFLFFNNDEGYSKSSDSFYFEDLRYASKENISIYIIASFDYHM